MTDYTTTGISRTGETSKTEIQESHEGVEGEFYLGHGDQCLDCLSLEELEQIQELLFDFINLRKPDGVYIK